MSASDDLKVDRAAAILTYAFRYALGRQTYAVAEVSGAVIAAAESLPKSTRALMVKEIREAIDTGHAGGTLDVLAWSDVAQRLEAVTE